jgi:hypothetical protein
MTARLTRSAGVLLMITAVTGCGRRPADGQYLSLSSSASVPAPAQTDLAHRDPAVWAAVKFELAHCQWDWRSPMAAYVGAQKDYASPEYGQQLAVAVDPTSWQQEVVKEQQVVTCAVSAPRRVLNAPSTASQVYVRMTAVSHITSTLGSFEAGDSTASWVVRLVDGHWLVTGPFEGG